MKLILVSLFLLLGVRAASAQYVYINPDTIYRAGDIILQNTDVYYGAASPDTNATRVQLSSQAPFLLDSNGLNKYWPTYNIIAHGAHTEVQWQRLFTARDKPISVNRRSDIIVGRHVTDDTAKTHGYGDVIISRNEDVDFRASGTIRLESGFHVMPGAFFHAYQEPRWDTAVFEDNFDSINRDQWFFANGPSSLDFTGIEAAADTNVAIYSDSEATDNSAIDLILREDTSLYTTWSYDQHDDHPCDPTLQSPPLSHRLLFSSAVMRSCPWPNKQTSEPFTLAYQHMPYGKWEMREKLPHLLYHNNQWMLGRNLEMNIAENEWVTHGRVHPTLYRNYQYGPFRGRFDTTGSVPYFKCEDADWCNSNIPMGITIEGFRYDVTLDSSDRVRASQSQNWYGGFPSSLRSKTDSITFYYEREEDNTSDNLTWKVKESSPGSGHWTKLYAPFHVKHNGDTLKFWKWCQPTEITLIVDTTFGQKSKKLKCHWESTFNISGDAGYVMIDEGSADSEKIVSGDLKTNTEAFTYHVSEGRGPGYPLPRVNMDTVNPSEYYYDTTGFQSTPYRYHTFTMEFLPNEVRYLIDSDVVMRLPDRMVPPGNRGSDWVSQIGRRGLTIIPAEFDIEGHLDGDIYGTHGSAINMEDSGSTQEYRQRKYLELHIGDCKGCWPYKGQPAAHLLLDYVKVWDIPRDVTISNLPD